MALPSHRLSLRQQRKRPLQPSLACRADGPGRAVSVPLAHFASGPLADLSRLPDTLPSYHVLIFTLAYIAMVPCANLIGFAGQEFARKVPHVARVLAEVT